MSRLTSLSVRLKMLKDTPKNVQLILSSLYLCHTYPNACNCAAGNHPFFNCERWEMIYPKDIPNDLCGYGYGEYLIFDVSLKNYDSEIEKFLDWIFPYCDQKDGDFLGIIERDGEWMTPVFYKREGRD